MKFLVDRCAGSRLAAWLRDQGHDALDLRELGKDPGDEKVLALAEEALAGGCGRSLRRGARSNSAVESIAQVDGTTTRVAADA